MGLVLATVAAYVMLALAVWGIPGPTAAWPALAMAAALLSEVLLLTFWNTWLTLGLTIDSSFSSWRSRGLTGRSSWSTEECDDARGLHNLLMT